MFELVKCNFCNRTKFTQIYEKSYLDEVYSIVRCKNCGLVFVNPQPSQERLKKFYDYELNSKKWLSQFPEELNASYYDERNKSGIEGYRTYLIKIQKFKNRGKILDVGCGDAAFFQLLNKNKWEMHGLDPSIKSAGFLKNKNRINFFHGTLIEANYPSNYFDTIVSFDVIEHLKNPLKVLKEMARVLKKQGILCLHTANINGWEARQQKENWIQLTPPGHLYYFTPKTLRKMLQKAGFKIIKFDMRMPLFSESNYSIVKENSNKNKSQNFHQVLSRKIYYSLKKTRKILKPLRPILYNKLCQLKGRIIGKHDITVYATKL